MADRAKVSSVDALEAFRNSLVIYLEKAKAVVDEVGGEVTSTRVWMENDRRVYWESQVRKRARVLEEAQQELFGARLSTLREATDVQQMAVNRAKRKLQEAEEKLKQVKQWQKRYDTDVQMLGKHLEKLRTVLSQDMGKALAYLNEMIAALDRYVRSAGPASIAPQAGDVNESEESTSLPEEST